MTDRNPAAASAAAAEWRFPNPATLPGSSAYYSVRFARPSLRDPLAALFAWRREVRRIIDDVSDPGVARLKLDWWRDEIRRSLDGTPRHPLSHLLASGPHGHHLLPAPFLDMAQRVEDELYARRCRDRAAQQRAMAQDRGALFELVCRCHGLSATDPLAAARSAGAWCGQVRRMRDGGLLLRRSREVVPQDCLRDAGLSHERLASPTHRNQLPRLLTEMAARLKHELPDVAGATRQLPRPIRIQMRIHAALLDALVDTDLAVVDQRVGLTPLRKLWIAWRTPR
jgi:phytoene synthase